MKKFATLLILFSLGLFTVGTIAGCGGGDDAADGGGGDAAPAADTSTTDSST